MSEHPTSFSGLFPKSKDAIRIGRLQKKIEKLKHQRDHWHKLYVHLKDVIAMAPFIEKAHVLREQLRESQRQNKMMEEIIKEKNIQIIEQSKLIHYLTEGKQNEKP